MANEVLESLVSSASVQSVNFLRADRSTFIPSSRPTFVTAVKSSLTECKSPILRVKLLGSISLTLIPSDRRCCRSSGPLHLQVHSRLLVGSCLLRRISNLNFLYSLMNRAAFLARTFFEEIFVWSGTDTARYRKSICLKKRASMSAQSTP